MIVSLLEHDDLKVRFANLVKGIGDLHSYIIQCPSLIRKVNYRCYEIGGSGIGGSDIGGFFIPAQHVKCEQRVKQCIIHAQCI